MPDVLAIITGERGQREIVRPLAAVGQPCAVLDWEELVAREPHPYFAFVRELGNLVRNHRGATVFTDMNSAFLAVILFAAKVHGCRVLMRLRGDPFAETRGQLRFHWEQRAWPQFARVAVAWVLDRPLFTGVDHFVPVSEWIVRRLGIADRSTIVRVPVPLEDFPAAMPQRGDILRLLAVTNFNFPQKVAALGRFLADHGDFLRAEKIRVTVAGAGIALEQFRERFGAQADFLGYVREVAALYREHDVFVHFSDLDAFPYVVLEAQASALPVIVNRDCGMLEQVEDGRTGFIVDLPDRPAVETHLRTLRASPETRARLGATAREHVASTYSLAEIGRGLLTALEPRSAG
jgi:glycosyltransferase involved in cell wall biosynthesis